ncbi:MAG: heme-binding protein [Burkholderiales bacterium]|nr:heme-binding protein [Burkholderiales bacterium]
MASLTLAHARTVIDHALAAARGEGFLPMGVVVVDAAAQVVASAREDGATALRLDIALGKAAAAVGMGANSRTLAERAKQLPAFFGAVSVASQQKFIPQTGAVLITDEAGAVLGAAGASGGTGDEDEQIVIAGIAAAGLKHA